VLGPTFDYTHRLIDFALAESADPPPPATAPADAEASTPRVIDIIAGDDLIEMSPPAEDGAPVADVTRDPTEFPAGRDARLQTLARGDEGFLLGLGYSTQRGYGRNHPFVGEIRFGEIEVEMCVAELGFAVPLGSIAVTECQMVNQFKGGGDGEPARFTSGYGLVFGQSERKAMSMALVDRALRADELAEERIGPAQDDEFVLSHCDNVQATGFVEHLKLPHYVDFQAELALLRELRREAGAHPPSAEAAE
jgi:alpha-D-ribose 1-methylphosphonate 5-triphosphate synthase subunit PhnI